MERDGMLGGEAIAPGNRPLVTIISPSFNHGRFIRATIESVLTQDYPNIEYLVMDGQSTDDTLSILREYDGRLRWTSESDRGQSHAINKGLRLTGGGIIGWLNSDDSYTPGAISAVVRAFSAAPEVALIYGKGNLIVESGQLLGPFIHTRPFDLWKLTKGVDYILQPSCFFTREAIETVGPVDERLNWCMDWDLWIRIGSRFKVMYIGECLSNARVHAKAKTSTGGLRRLRELLAMQRRHNARLLVPETLGLIAGYVKSVSYDRLMQGLHISEAFGAEWRKRIRALLFESQGVYGDSSLGRRAHFLFPFGVAATHIKFDLERGDHLRASPLSVIPIVNGRRLGAQSIAATGPCSVLVPYDRSRGTPTEVTLAFRRVFSQGGWRRRSCLLRAVSLEG